MSAAEDIAVSPRLVRGMSNADYHAHPAISSSALNTALRSALHYNAQYVTRAIERTETPSMRLGTAVHTAVLEPEAWDERYVVAPSGIDRRTKAGKEAWAEFEASAAGREVISSEDAAKAHAIAHVVHDHSEAGAWLAGDLERPEREVSVFWREGDLEARCRPDALGEGVIIDLKTTQDASPEGFAKSVATYGYHVQAAWYRRGLRALTGMDHRHIIIAVETSAPYAVAVYELDDDALADGEHDAEVALRRIARGIETGRWPGYAEGTQSLALPKWKKREVEL